MKGSFLLWCTVLCGHSAAITGTHATVTEPEALPAVIIPMPQESGADHRFSRLRGKLANRAQYSGFSKKGLPRATTINGVDLGAYRRKIIRSNDERILYEGGPEESSAGAVNSGETAGSATGTANPTGSAEGVGAGSATGAGGDPFSEDDASISKAVPYIMEFSILVCSGHNGCGTPKSNLTAAKVEEGDWPEMEQLTYWNAASPRITATKADTDKPMPKGDERDPSSELSKGDLGKLSEFLSELLDVPTDLIFVRKPATRIQPDNGVLRLPLAVWLDDRGDVYKAASSIRRLQVDRASMLKALGREFPTKAPGPWIWVDSWCPSPDGPSDDGAPRACKPLDVTNILRAADAVRRIGPGQREDHKVPRKRTPVSMVVKASEQQEWKGSLSNSDCSWDYKDTGCTPDAYCHYKYKFGDMTLDTSCRLIDRPTGISAQRRDVEKYGKRYGDFPIDPALGVPLTPWAEPENMQTGFA